MPLPQLLDRILNLFVKPFMVLSISLIAGILTALTFARRFSLPPSLKTFRSIWFSRLWSLLGPISAKGDAPHVRPLVQQAHGVVVELGPGTGLTAKFYDKTRLTKIYGIEPCLEMHPELRANIAAAGLSDIYTVVGCGAQDLAQLRELGIVPESVDTILTVKVLCSVPSAVLEKTLAGLYELLVPGGEWLVFEHVRNKKSWVTGMFQSLYQLVWPVMLAGCNIDRRSDEMLAAVGDWERNELEVPKGEFYWEIIPHVMGRLVKPGRP